MPEDKKKGNDKVYGALGMAGAGTAIAGYAETARRNAMPGHYTAMVKNLKRRAAGEEGEFVGHHYGKYKDRYASRKRRNKNPIGEPLTRDEYRGQMKGLYKEDYPDYPKRNQKHIKRVEARYGEKMGIGFVKSGKSASGKPRKQRKAVEGVWKDGKFTPKTRLTTVALRKIFGPRASLPWNGRPIGTPPVREATSQYAKSQRPTPKTGYRKKPGTGKHTPNKTSYGDPTLIGKFKKQTGPGFDRWLKKLARKKK